MKDANTNEPKRGDRGTVEAAHLILDGQQPKGRLARLMPFLGPAFVASVAYVDPGNFATNIQGGAQYGYTLLWVIVASNLMAMLIQALSAKLGIATGMNLAEHCRAAFPRAVVWGMWVLMEIVAMATDLAEFLGAALGFNLLFHIPLWVGGLLTAVATFLILGLERHGFRPLEAVITILVGIVAGCYLVETVLEMALGRLAWGQMMVHAVVPQFSGMESVVLAAGILGATVMPHAIFLHSALTQGRVVVRNDSLLRRLYRFELVDVGVAMTIAGFVNAAMLIMAAATFHTSGYATVGTIEEAYRTLEPLLGTAASWVFAVSLLAAGLSSSAVGTMAGQVIMQGFLHRHIPPWVRRAVTMAPSLAVIFAGLDPTRTLVISQVVLSFGLPFAIIPLVMFTSRRARMGVLVNRKFTTLAVAVIAALIVLLNFYLLYQTFWGG
jgi:manganese transport protein